MEFQCENCGEIFTAEPEADHTDPMGGTIHSATCPECKHTAWELDD